MTKTSGVLWLDVTSYRKSQGVSRCEQDSKYRASVHIRFRKNSKNCTQMFFCSLFQMFFNCCTLPILSLPPQCFLCMQLEKRTGHCDKPLPHPTVKQNVLPMPAPSDSTQTRPPCTSMIRLTSARPIPVPALFTSSLLKRPKMFS